MADVNREFERLVDREAEEHDMDQCTCYPTTTILCAYCEANLCDRCTEPEDLCTCPDDGAPLTREEVTAGGPPAWDTRDKHDRSL